MIASSLLASLSRWKRPSVDQSCDFGGRNPDKTAEFDDVYPSLEDPAANAGLCDTQSFGEFFDVHQLLHFRPPSDCCPVRFLCLPTNLN